MNKDYENLVNFWNESFKVTEGFAEEVRKEFDPENDYKELAPSEKLYKVLSLFSNCDNVLDYGCGSGWASMILAKYGVKNILAVDVAKNSIDMVNLYKDLFKVNDNIKALFIDENWLANQKSSGFAGFFSSNVIDVVPLEMAQDIIKNSAKVVKNGAPVIFSLNFYIDPKEMEKRGCKIKGTQVYINDILRLNSLNDDEWKKEFEKYFIVKELIYFSWPGEKEEKRRIFVLEKK